MVIKIQDSGLGIDQNAYENLFKPFFTTKAPGKGTGLGLAVCHYIITENHHGILEAENNPDRGATFTIRLPVS